MDFLGIAIGVIGVFATWIVARIYYRKSEKFKWVNISLHEYNDFGSLRFDEKINKKISIHFEGKEVEKLIQLKFRFENVGELPISNCLTPLIMKIPKGLEVIDFAVTKVDPEIRNASIKKSEKDEVFIEFDLLNPYELIVFEGLFKAKSDFNLTFGKYIEELKFSISCEDLPEKIPVHNKTVYQTIPIKEIIKVDLDWANKYKSQLEIAVWMVFIVGFFYAYLLVLLGQADDQFAIWRIKTFFKDFNGRKLFVVISWFWGVLLGVNSIYVFLKYIKKQIEKIKK